LILYEVAQKYQKVVGLDSIFKLLQNRRFIIDIKVMLLGEYRMKQFNKTLLTLCIGLATHQASSAGFQLNTQSATGLGRAFAGDAIIADNASVMSRNPASMALFDHAVLSLGATYADTDVKLSDIMYGDVGLDNEHALNTQSVDASAPAIPNFFAVVPLDSNWSLGMGLYTNFGAALHYSKDFEASEFGGDTEIKTINAQLSTAYRINKNWSVGAGIDVIRGSGNIKREATNPQDGKKFTALEIDSQGTGIGFHTGIAYEMNADHRFGFSYRYSPEIKAKGDVTSMAIVQRRPAPELYKNDTLHLNLPDLYEFSGYHRLTPRFAVHYSFEYMSWHKFKSLKTDHFNEIKTFHWKDAWHASIGQTYTLDQNWTLRAGYMYETQAVDKEKSIALPDSTHHWFSGGVGYQFDKHHTLDFGITYLAGDSVEVYEKSPKISGLPQPNISGKTSVHAMLYGLQYSYDF